MNMNAHFKNWQTISAGAWHTAAIRDDGTLWAWGQNNFGQLGDGTTTDSSIPVQESTKTNDWKTVYAGVTHTTAIKNDGTLWAWGQNYYDQLGDGTTTDSSIPVQESTKTNDWKAVSAGACHTTAIKNDGTLWAWGGNIYGRLVSSTTTGNGIPVQENTKANDWKAIYAGGNHTAATKDDGTLWAWGQNVSGQLGYATTTDSSSPVQENTKANDWKTIYAGVTHTAAIKNDGTLWAWGQNNFGQLGDGTTTQRSIPVQENTRANNWKAVCAGYWHTAAIKEDGTLWAWGQNNFGQLGDGTTTQRSIPVQENTRANNWKVVCVGYWHTVAIKDDGTLWTWGYNNFGQLGNGTTTGKEMKAKRIKQDRIRKLQADSAEEWIKNLMDSSGYPYKIANENNKLLLFVKINEEQYLEIPVYYESFQETVPQILETIQQVKNIKIRVLVKNSSPGGHSQWLNEK